MPRITSSRRSTLPSTERPLSSHTIGIPKGPSRNIVNWTNVVLSHSTARSGRPDRPRDSVASPPANVTLADWPMSVTCTPRVKRMRSKRRFFSGSSSFSSITRPSSRPTPLSSPTVVTMNAGIPDPDAPAHPQVGDRVSGGATGCGCGSVPYTWRDRLRLRTGLRRDGVEAFGEDAPLGEALGAEEGGDGVAQRRGAGHVGVVAGGVAHVVADPAPQGAEAADGAGTGALDGDEPKAIDLLRQSPDLVGVGQPARTCAVVEHDARRGGGPGPDLAQHGQHRGQAGTGGDHQDGPVGRPEVEPA